MGAGTAAVNGWTAVTTSPDVEIVEVDPRDDAAFARWFAVADASDRHDRPDEPNWLLHEQQRISLGDEDDEKQLLAAQVDGAVVGVARISLPLKDNLHLVEVVLAVHPDARRRGAGRALDEEVVRRVRAAGRTTILGMCDEPPGTEGRSAGRLGAIALGYDVCQEEVRRDIDLPLDTELVQHLQETCRPHATDYEIRTWWDRCPDDLLDDRARLSEAMSTDIPKDSMDWREEVWDADRVRRNERLAQEMDRTFVSAGAVHVPTGRLVAYTDMGIARVEPRRAYQWDTLVLGEHRGHRLGMLMKLAALQELHRQSPKTEFISTWNAKENEPMIAVNDALGARTNGGIASLQKVLG